MVSTVSVNNKGKEVGRSFAVPTMTVSKHIFLRTATKNSKKEVPAERVDEKDETNVMHAGKRPEQKKVEKG